MLYLIISCVKLTVRQIFLRVKNESFQILKRQNPESRVKRDPCCFAFLNPKPNKLPLPCEVLNFLSFVDHAFTKAVIGQSPSRVVVRYPHHTPLQWAE